VVQRRVDGFAVFADASAELDEARDPAAPGPAEPGIQQPFAFLALEGEDLPELLLSVNRLSWLGTPPGLLVHPSSR